MINATPTRSFPLGLTVITRNAQSSLNAEDVKSSLARHARGDWGDIGSDDAEENEFALNHDLRLFSVYHDRNESKFWIITEADRSVTTVLLPEDY